MDLLTLLLLALGLCFDSFAVSVSCGMNHAVWTRARGVRFAAILGLFQGIMPLIGWSIASEFSKVIADYDHWIAFLLLAFLGLRMIRQSLRPEDDPRNCDHFNMRNGMVMGFATSIDALIAGVAMAMVSLELVSGSQLINMLVASGIIFLVTVVASLAGLFIGRRSRRKIGGRAELIGGAILILIGLKVLLEHICE